MSGIRLACQERLLREAIEDFHIFTAILYGRGSEFCFIPRQRAEERLELAKRNISTLTERINYLRAEEEVKA